MRPLICVLDLAKPDPEPDFMDLTQLEGLLNNPTEAAPPVSCPSNQQTRRLFVVQTPGVDHDPSIDSRLRRLLRERLNVPERIFHAQYWSQTTFRFNETINCPRLPTTTRPRSRFSLEYFELWDVVNDGPFSYRMRNDSTVKCAATGRPIQCHKWSTTSGWLLIAPRKCSFWLDENVHGKNAVVLCDPPPERVVIDGVEIELNLRAFEGGYHGFIPESALEPGKHEAPRHTSLFRDLIYYVQNHSSSVVMGVSAPHDPGEVAATFLRKIVASHYCELLGFVGHQTAAMRSSGWAVQRRTQQEIDESLQVETAWSHFKCPEYLEALSAALDALGLPQGHDPYDLFDAGPRRAEEEEAAAAAAPVRGRARANDDDWRSPAPDFLYLHREFRLRLADYARMTSSLAALNGMIGGRLSILEARTARSLTLVAMLFAPPACVASIFSIPSEGVFGEAGPPFWCYWAAAVPLTVLVFLLTYLVHERDVVRRLWRARRPRRGAAGAHQKEQEDGSEKV